MSWYEIDINDPYFNEPQPYSYIPESDVITAGTGAGIGSITNNPFNPSYGIVDNPNRSGGNNPMNPIGNPNIVPTAARIPVAPPPGYRPGIDPEWNYFPNSNPPATTMGQYPYGITPPANLPSFGNALAGIQDLDLSSLDLSNLDLSGLGFSQPSTLSVEEEATPEIEQPTMPEIDYDLLASKINFPSQPAFEMPDYGDLTERLAGIEQSLSNMPTFQMPDYTQQFENLQTGLGGLGSQIGGLQMPSFEMPEFDYNQLAGNIAGQIQMPSFEMPDYSQQFENLQQGIGGLGTQFSNFQMPSFEMPDYSQQFSDLSTQIGNMPSFEMHDYGQQFQDLQTGLGTLGQQIGGMGYSGPSLEQIQEIMSGYQMPDYYSQFQNLEDQIANIGYGGTNLYNDPFSSGFGVSDRPGGFGGFAKGGSIRYQAGEGIAGLEEGAEMTEGNEQLIQATIMVIEGMAPDQATADAIINQFIGLYGQEAFMVLREQVLNPDGQAQTQGIIEGFGGGMDDFVQGVAGNQNRIAASPGEYIVPADVVSQLGDGNSEEGSRKLDGMLDRTRMAKTGTIKQAEPIDSRR